MFIEKLTFIESCIGIILNLLAFVLFKYNHSIKSDRYFLFLKWTRLLDILLPLSAGVMTNLVNLLPFQGNASSGVCFWLQSPFLCNYMIMLNLISITINNVVRKLSYMYRYNVFVINKPIFHCTKFEKYFTIFGLILALISLSITHTFPLKEDEYKNYYEDIDIVFKSFPNSSYIIVLYDPRISPKNSFMVVYSVGFAYTCITIFIMIFWYAIPLEKKLRQCKKEGRNETNCKITVAIFYLRISIILPIFCSLLPTSIIYHYFLLSHESLENEFLVATFTPLIYQTYSIINPIVIMIQGKIITVKSRSKVSKVNNLNLFIVNKFFT
uniref:G_PROTEIN_RECEP_F1_2 domain-containing protein n=1 Tax=Strongyloides papillosus TaxID=174720 RepID=A0A0N5CCJ5_STREA